MNYGQIIRVFFSDDKIGVALLLVFLDLILGTVAAFRLGTFRLSYAADFLRNDILYKLVPYFVVYAGALLAGHQHFLVDGLDLGLAAGLMYAWLVAAMAGSILSSLGSLGVPLPRPDGLRALFAGENAAPPKD